MKRAIPFCIFALVVSVTNVCGGVRHCTFLYEAPTSPPGSIEMENWVTWSRTTDPARVDEVAFRHELEFGVTDRFQASVYLADWSYTNSRHNSGTVFLDAALIRSGSRFISNIEAATEFLNGNRN
jgi:hypothetical protein